VKKEIANVTEQNFAVGDDAKGILFLKKSWQGRGAFLITQLK
jgi:hypothetical protein